MIDLLLQPLAMEHVHTPNPYAAPRAEPMLAAVGSASSSPGRGRPRSVTVIGGIAVFMGGVNLLFLPFVFFNRDDQMRIFAEMGYQTPVVYALQVVFPLLFLALLVTGRGLLRMRLWAPRAFRWYATASAVVLASRALYVGSNLAAGVRPLDPILYQTMQLQLVGDALLITYALAGALLLSRDAVRTAFDPGEEPG